ncbi:MAG: hypothetical protein M3380_05185 [Chloroflexota bacterium]|nr:hypothetical protein [Chloroflexota bacterium]
MAPEAWALAAVGLWLGFLLIFELLARYRRRRRRAQQQRPVWWKTDADPEVEALLERRRARWVRKARRGPHL